MKNFNAIRFFFGLMIAVGLLLFSAILFLVDAGLTQRLAHLTVQLILFVPMALLITRLRAKACGLSFWPRMPERQDDPVSFGEELDDQLCVCGEDNPDLMEREELRSELDELRRELKKTKKSLAMKNLDPPWEAFI